MDKSKKKIITTAIFLPAFILGWYHLRMGMEAIFVFRDNEPLASWVGIIAGPLSTLPATILALFKRQIGGYWLIAGGLISFVAIILVPEGGDFLTLALRVALIILLPMIGLGAAFVLLTNKQNLQTEIGKGTQQGNQGDGE